MAQEIAVSTADVPDFATELAAYIDENRETIDALGALVVDSNFVHSELGKSFLSDGVDYFVSMVGEEDRTKVRDWFCSQASSSASFLIGVAAYLEGVKFVADCLLLKKAS